MRNDCLFSMPGANGRWQVHELTLADGRARELPLIHGAGRGQLRGLLSA
jgi:hypothetical protein